MEEEQQQQPQIQEFVLTGIARLSDPVLRAERHKLYVDGSREQEGVNRRSIQHLVTFLDDNRDNSHEVVMITELELAGVWFPRRHDGSDLQVLCALFSRSDTTLTRVTLENCSFGTLQDASRLLAAFHTNRTVTDLAIRRIRNLNGAALFSCISSLVQNMPQLQRLDCSSNWLCVEGVRAFQPGLESNRTLRELHLSHGFLGDEGIHVLADALVGNTTMDVLGIGSNGITSVGLDDITRLLRSTHLSTISLNRNYEVFDDEASTQRFARVLSRHEFLKKLNLFGCRLENGGIRIIAHGVVENTTMKTLIIGGNDITSVGLDDITQLLVESTRLRSIYFRYNDGIFDDEAATHRFVSALQHKYSCVQELPGIRAVDLPASIREASYANINHSLTRNRQLNSLNLLLAPPSLSRPQQQQHQQRNAATTLMLKISHKAITKFATVPNNAGASAIFKLFSARPQLLEKRLQRPMTTTTATAAAAAAAVSVVQKRRRL